MDFTVEFLVAFGQRRQTLHNFAGMGGEEGRDVAHDLFLLRDQGQRAATGDGFDTANARRERAFAYELEQADVARARDVRAAAKLDGNRLGGIAHDDHANLIAVLFAKESHRAHLDRLVLRKQARDDLVVRADHGVDVVLKRRDVFGRQAAREIDIETQPVRRNRRAFLRAAFAETLAKRRVQ